MNSSPDPHEPDPVANGTAHGSAAWQPEHLGDPQLETEAKVVADYAQQADRLHELPGHQPGNQVAGQERGMFACEFEVPDDMRQELLPMLGEPDDHGMVAISSEDLAAVE